MAIRRSRRLLALSPFDMADIDWENYSAAQGAKFAFRLRKLADLLEGLSPAQFRFESWITKYHPKRSCQTVACALGHAVVNRHQKFRGLQLKIRHAWPWEGAKAKEAFLCPTGKFFNYRGFGDADGEAADDYFGPGSYDLAFLGMNYFYRDEYRHRVPYDIESITAKMAVKRLRELAKHWEKKTANNLSPSRRNRKAV